LGQRGEILQGLWRFEAAHPEWTDEARGEDGWDEVVAWWAVATSRGLLLIDPLVFDWDELDAMIGEHGGCAGVVRTCHWHQRSVAAAASRYGAGVWAKLGANGDALQPLDHALGDAEELWDGIQALAAERDDEIALWLPAQAALLFGDAMLRRDTGELRVCPDSWTQPAGGPARLRAVLGGLTQYLVEHVLVSHGPLVLGGGLEALRAAVS
jgi:glyoxylase-like metal-dependent hydrolase (beta-lactamase superfamily II)